MKKKRFLLLGLLVGLMVFALGVANASAEVTWDPINKGSDVTLSNGNLTANVVSTAIARANEGKASGKWYWEVKVNSTCEYLTIGVCTPTVNLNTYFVDECIGWKPGRGITTGGSDTLSPTTTVDVNDVVGIALDLDNDTIAFYKNGDIVVSASLTSASFTPGYNEIFPALGTNNNTYGWISTANFGATSFAYTIPDGYLPYDYKSPATKTLDITAVDTASVGDAITADVVINGATNTYAEDIRVTYDTDLLTYVDYTEITGLKVFSATEPTPGTLRFIIASQGEANVVNGTKTLLTLNFTAKAAGDALVDITAGRIADTTQETDITADQCGEKTITIGASLDVNRSGEFTLLDLAIDAWYHGKTVAETDTTLYDADVIVDTNIDDLDLTEIVNRMLQNTNYAPNNS